MANENETVQEIIQYVDEQGNPIDPSLIDENGNYIGNVNNVSTNTNASDDIANANMDYVQEEVDEYNEYTGMVTFDYNNVPITDIVNSIILDAIHKGGSDIHFDPYDNGIKIRIRVDGQLKDYSLVPLYVKKNMITRIKIISGMNITEARVPQDGAIRTELDNTSIDLRVSCLPTNMGEKIVIRIMDYSMSADGIETLDFSEKNLEKVKKMLELPNGIILVTGATGSGKSTTVYSMLQVLNKEESNIVTVEDPIEMNIEGINQVQAQTEIGLNFATVLRSILRQDPDVIMIGEIRDDETARIAVRASITGHLVLSTIHTNNSLATIERLTDMSVEKYLLGTSLSGIISQKLARRLCTKCKRKRKTTKYEKLTFRKALGKIVKEIYEPVGCPECIKGYHGRIPIHEVLYLTQEVRDAITSNASKNDLRQVVYGGENPTITMLQDGLSKVLDGNTSFEEILKLIDLDDDLGTNTQLGFYDQLDASVIGEIEEIQDLIEVEENKAYDEDFELYEQIIGEEVEIDVKDTIDELNNVFEDKNYKILNKNEETLKDKLYELLESEQEISLDSMIDIDLTSDEEEEEEEKPKVSSKEEDEVYNMLLGNEDEIETMPYELKKPIEEIDIEMFQDGDDLSNMFSQEIKDNLLDILREEDTLEIIPEEKENTDDGFDEPKEVNTKEKDEILDLLSEEDTLDFSVDKELSDDFVNENELNEESNKLLNELIEQNEQTIENDIYIDNLIKDINSLSDTELSEDDLFKDLIKDED